MEKGKSDLAIKDLNPPLSLGRLVRFFSDILVTHIAIASGALAFCGRRRFTILPTRKKDFIQLISISCEMSAKKGAAR